jgi:hypothetical protein
MVLSQIRQDPSADARAVLANHEERLAPVIGKTLARSVRRDFRLLAPFIVFINGAAWDAAAQALMAAASGIRMKLDVEAFLDFATAGLAGMACPRKER